MNDDFTQDQAGYFAKRIIQQAGNDATRQATIALEQALAGPPAESRVKDAVAFLAEQRRLHQAAGRNAADAEQQAVADLAHVLFNTNEFIYLD